METKSLHRFMTLECEMTIEGVSEINFMSLTSHISYSKLFLTGRLPRKENFETISQ